MCAATSQSSRPTIVTARSAGAMTHRTRVVPTSLPGSGACSTTRPGNRRTERLLLLCVVLVQLADLLTYGLARLAVPSGQDLNPLAVGEGAIGLKLFGVLGIVAVFALAGRYARWEGTIWVLFGVAVGVGMTGVVANVGNGHLL